MIRVLAVLALAATGIASLPPVARAPATLAAAREVPRAAGERLLVVGVDGVDWRYMEPLMARGELPRFAALRARGTAGRLRTIQPTLSPVVWTTIVTGKLPAEHGVSSFLIPRLEGVDDALPELLPTRGVGFDVLSRWLRASGRIDSGPVTSAVRRVPAFWNIASRNGSPVSVLNWWATWPAEAVLGHVVSERAYYRAVESPEASRGERVTFPERLFADVARRVLRPAAVTLETAREFMEVTEAEWRPPTADDYAARKGIVGEFPYFYSLFESTRRLALFLIEQGRAEHPAHAPDLFVLFRFVDMACHASLKDSELAGAPPGLEASRRYGRVVTSAYRAMDRALGEIVDAFGEGSVIVVSDHGFDMIQRGAARRAGHGHAPDGIWLGAGPAFRPGWVKDLGVEDILPLLLYLKGFPVADDLAGRLREQALSADYLAAHEVRRIASYGTRDASGESARDDAKVEVEMIERLRALGYVE